MKNKYVLVTGASSGIGFQTAKDFLREGAFVGAHYSSDKKGIERLLKHSRSGRCKILRADFSSPGEILGLWNEFTAWSKERIDVLVNNAGEVNRASMLAGITEEIWERTFRVNAEAPFLLSREALSIMSKKRSGRIINLSSVGIKFGGSSSTLHYSASKVALEGITRSFAKAGAPFNVLVNAVRTGVTDTPLHKKTGRKDLAKRISLIPLKRLARASEISNVVMFLAGEKSSFVTGAVIDVTGGE